MQTVTHALRRRLGRTDMEVFPLNLGGNVFGWTADRDATFAVLDAYFEAGGNFIDTADAYNKWVPGHHGGESETLIGEWLKSRVLHGMRTVNLQSPKTILVCLLCDFCET